MQGHILRSSSPNPHKHSAGINCIDDTSPFVLSVENLSVYREAPLIRGIDWQVGHSEHWCILGANGSGKTTLLGAITAYTPPTEGRIMVCGREYGKYDWRELRKSVGLVSHRLHDSLESRMTALDVVAGGRDACLTMPRRRNAAVRRRALDMLRTIECQSVKQREWYKLSQGEKQRILIGRALMAKNALLILDEPCAGLDPVGREYFLQFLNGLAQKKKSPVIILVTHHVEEIMPFITHVLVLKNGSVFLQGKKENVMSSENLSEAFGVKIHLVYRDSRYKLSVTGQVKTVM